MKEIFNLIEKESERQQEKWGEQNHPSLDLILLNREGSCTTERMCQHYEIPSDNRAKQMCDFAAELKELTWAHIAIEEMSEAVSEFDPEKRKTELIQLAAVICNWIKSIDRNEIKN